MPSAWLRSSPIEGPTLQAALPSRLVGTLAGLRDQSDHLGERHLNRFGGDLQSASPYGWWLWSRWQLATDHDGELLSNCSMSADKGRLVHGKFFQVLLSAGAARASSAAIAKMSSADGLSQMSPMTRNA